MYEEIAKSHLKLKKGKVWCKSCKKCVDVNSADCLINGWPKCCGYTMTIDSPDTWNPDK